MKFDLEYTALLPLKDFVIDIYEDDLDYLGAYLLVIEDALTQTGNVQFHFECLGEKWNVYIWGDFSVFCEHLVGLYDFCMAKDEPDFFILDFYEQGIERKLEFSRYEGYILEIKNKSAGWEAPLQNELLNKDRLASDIRIFIEKIRSAVAIVCPAINELEMVERWYSHFIGE